MEAEELAAAFAEVWSLLRDDQTLTLGTAFEGTRYLAHEEPNLHSVLGHGWGPTATEALKDLAASRRLVKVP